MSSRLNLEALRAAKLEYVTRLSSASFAALLEQLPAEEQPELGDRQNLVELEHEGQTLRDRRRPLAAATGHGTASEPGG